LGYQNSIDELVISSASLRLIHAYALKLANTDTTVLITGETGTGKELISQLIHSHSARKERSFVCMNCAAVPDALLESELFGFEKGAFTGAASAHSGKFLLANGGTLFLDEIGDLTLQSQAKLLRAIETRQVYRLGARVPTAIDIRIIAATNQDLEQLAREGRFRTDLYYRLNVARIVIPPLRSRKDDIPALVAHFVGLFSRKFAIGVDGVTPDAMDCLLRHDWPGNVRELKNVIEAAFLAVSSPLIQARDLPPALAGAGDDVRTPDEREDLLRALLATNWNKSKAAEKLQWSRMTVYRKIAKYGLHDHSARQAEATRAARV
jgi:transcriptional regulator with PAS, ATPase and Fis domain